jgi:alkanesulfonate monooxygenase SsuD/methylene tetrahydromethanopterin reductase-like flavin-dependent oxidoreductase (luciferase family)
MPADVALPPIHLLGSSGYSAELAAVIGAGFAFGDATERAYQRFDLPKKRRALAEAWAAFCLSPPAVETGTVLPMQLAR